MLGDDVSRSCHVCVCCVACVFGHFLFINISPAAAKPGANAPAAAQPQQPGMMRGIMQNAAGTAMGVMGVSSGERSCRLFC